MHTTSSANAAPPHDPGAEQRALARSLEQIEAVALDCAPHTVNADSRQTFETLLLCLLERAYRVYLFSTSEHKKWTHTLQDPRIVRLTAPPNQDPAIVQAHPQLCSKRCLWVTKDALLQGWLAAQELPLATWGKNLPEYSWRITQLAELTTLLDPSALLLREIVRRIQSARKVHAGALLIGIGGPASAGSEALAEALAQLLCVQEEALTERLPLDTLLPTTESLSADASRHGTWCDQAAGSWIETHLLTPLHAGEPAYHPQPPRVLPPSLCAHFPLYCAEESILLLSAEMPFASPLDRWLHMRILLELSEEECARRTYELPPGSVDLRFRTQYAETQGQRYTEYLHAANLPQRADIRVDATQSKAWRMLR